jgi:hypothetical protein
MANVFCSEKIVGIHRDSKAVTALHCKTNCLKTGSDQLAFAGILAYSPPTTTVQGRISQWLISPFFT